MKLNFGANNYIFNISENILTSTSRVAECHRHPHKLWVSGIVPHKQLLPRKDLPDCPVVYTAMVLEHHHVLFFLVPSTTNKSHPTGISFVFSVEVMTDLTIVEDLGWKENVTICCDLWGNFADSDCSKANWHSPTDSSFLGAIAICVVLIVARQPCLWSSVTIDRRKLEIISSTVKSPWYKRAPKQKRHVFALQSYPFYRRKDRDACLTYFGINRILHNREVSVSCWSS